MRSRILRAGAVAALALLASSATAQLLPNCARILAGFRSPEINSPSSSVVWDRDGAGPEQPILVISINGDLGGPFGNQAIVGWDGESWVRIFPGTPTTSQLSNLFVHDGNLYGLAVNTLVQVTPSGYSTVTPNFGTMKEAISFNGEIVACGTSPASVNGVFALRNGAWVQLGSAFNGAVNSISIFNGQLVAGGAFTLPGISNVRAAVFNGTDWSPLGTSFDFLGPLTVTRIRGMGSKALISNDIVVAVLEQNTWTRARENGQILLATDTHAYVSSTSSEPGIIKRFDGTVWTWLNNGSLQLASVRGIAEYQGQVYAFGPSASGFSYAQTSALRSGGSLWSRFGESTLGPVRDIVAAADGTVLTAAGYRNAVLDPGSQASPAPRVWDGTRFRPAGDPFPGPPLINNPPASSMLDLVSDPEFDILGAGYFYSGGFLPPYCVARYQSDSTWGPLGLPFFNFVSGGIDSNPRAFKLLRYRGELLALGEFSVTAAKESASIARFQSDQWTLVDPTLTLPAPGSRIRNAIAFDDKLFLVGTVLNGPALTTGTFMYYNGTAWSLPTNALRATSAFHVHNGVLHAVAADGFTIVRWNGSGWDPLVASPPSFVHALASYRGLLFAGGEFGLRYFNGTAWVTPANVGIFGAVFALREHNNELLVGGALTASFGSNSAANFARFTADYVPPFLSQPLSRTGACGETTKLSVTLAPNYGFTTFRWNKDGVQISDGPTGNGSTYAGTGTRELSIINLNPLDAGSYTCSITVVCGGRTSDPAVLAAACCPADLNNDLMVDDLDFQLFAPSYDALTCASPAMPVGCQADFNADGMVDDADFLLFLLAYNTAVCP